MRCANAATRRASSKDPHMKRTLILVAAALALVACQPKGKEAAGPAAPTEQSASSKAFMANSTKPMRNCDVGVSLAV